MKSETCTVTIPEYELTIPSSKGQLTTVEGIIRDVTQDLSADQPVRRIQDETTYLKIQALIDKFKEILADNDDDDDEVDTVGAVKSKSAAYKDAPMPAFTVKLDDPSGNSFLEFVGSMADPKWNMRTYHRTKENNIALGLVAPDEQDGSSALKPILESDDNAAKEDIGGGLEGENEEIYVFPGVCSSCGHPLNTYMKKVVIPYFKVSRLLVSATTANVWQTGYLDHVNKLRSLWLQRQ